MSEINIHRIDLNLLVVFEALLAERHVGRAASTLSLTQSAVSHALGRLRELFSDPLFFRTAGGVAPTERALALEPELREILSRTRQLISAQAHFNPQAATDRVVIGLTDYASAVVLPSLAAYLEREAPNLRVVLRVDHPDFSVNHLDTEQLDFSIAPVWSAVPKRISVTPLFLDQFVLTSRKGHPMLSRKTSLDVLKGLSRVVVSSRIDGSSVSEPSLIKAGFSRHPAMVIPHFLAAPFILDRTDYIAFIPEKLSRQLSSLAPLQMHPSPIALPVITMALMYHQKRVAASPCLHWVASAIKHSQGIDADLP